MSSNTLEELIDLSRHSASLADLQPLKYILSCDPKQDDLIFLHMVRAGYLKDWDGPPEGDRLPALGAINMRTILELSEMGT